MTDYNQHHIKKDVFGWKKNIVKSPSAPMLYSQQAIWAFSAFFTAVFGAALLCMNIKQSKGRLVVFSFAIVFTLVEVLVLNHLRPHAAVFFAINGGGGYLLTQLFWVEYIGIDTVHRVRPVWIPLIISLLILILLIASLIYGEASRH